MCYKSKKKLKDIIGVSKGPFKKDVTGVQGEGAPKNSDKKWHRGERVYVISDITTKKNMYKFLFYTCFWSVRQQMNLMQKMLTRWKRLRSPLTDHV